MRTNNIIIDTLCNSIDSLPCINDFTKGYLTALVLPILLNDFIVKGFDKEGDNNEV